MNIDMIKSSSSSSSLSSSPSSIVEENMDMMMNMMMQNSYFSNNTAVYTNPTIFLGNPFQEPTKYPNPNHLSSEMKNSMGAMREMIFRMAAMQPIHIDPESVKAPKRRNVKISKDPQSVAARHRREKISERIRILQRIVPGGTKMDTASMLDEAIHYVKFLKKQVQTLEQAGFGDYSSSNNHNNNNNVIGSSMHMLL